MSDTGNYPNIPDAKCRVLISEVPIQHQETVNLSSGQCPLTRTRVVSNSGQEVVSRDGGMFAPGTNIDGDVDSAGSVSSLILGVIEDELGSVIHRHLSPWVSPPAIDTNPIGLTSECGKEVNPYYDLDYICSYAFQSGRMKASGCEYDINAFIHSTRCGLWPQEPIVKTSPRCGACGQSEERPWREAGMVNESFSQDRVEDTRNYRHWQSESPAGDEPEGYMKCGSVTFNDECNPSWCGTGKYDDIGEDGDFFGDVDVVLTLLCARGSASNSVLDKGRCRPPVPQFGAENIGRVWDDDGILPSAQRVGWTTCLLEGWEGEAMHQAVRGRFPSTITCGVDRSPHCAERYRAPSGVNFELSINMVPDSSLCAPALDSLVDAGRPLEIIEAETEPIPHFSFPLVSLPLTSCARGRVSSSYCSLSTDNLVEDMEYPYLGGLRDGSKLFPDTPLLLCRSICTVRKGEVPLFSEEVPVLAQAHRKSSLSSAPQRCANAKLFFRNELLSAPSDVVSGGSSCNTSLCQPVGAFPGDDQVVRHDVCASDEWRAPIDVYSSTEASHNVGVVDRPSVGLAVITAPLKMFQTVSVSPATTPVRRRWQMGEGHSASWTPRSCFTEVVEAGMLTLNGRPPPVSGASERRFCGYQNHIRLVVVNHKTRAERCGIHAEAKLHGEDTLEIRPARSAPHFFKVDEYLECTDDNGLHSVILTETQKRFLGGTNAVVLIAGTESVSLAGWRAAQKVINCAFRDISDEHELFMSAALIRQGAVRDLLSKSDSTPRIPVGSMTSLRVAFKDAVRTKLRGAHHFAALLSGSFEVANLNPSDVASCVAVSIMLKQVEERGRIVSSMLIVGGTTPDGLRVLLGRDGKGAQRQFCDIFCSPRSTVMLSSLHEGDKNIVSLLDVQLEFLATTHKPVDVKGTRHFTKEVGEGVAGCIVDEQNSSEKGRSLREEVKLPEGIASDLKTLPLIEGVKESLNFERHSDGRSEFRGRHSSRQRSLSSLLGDETDFGGGYVLRAGEGQSKERRELRMEKLPGAQGAREGDESCTKLITVGSDPPPPLPQRSGQGDGIVLPCLFGVTANYAPLLMSPQPEWSLRPSNKRPEEPTRSSQVNYTTDRVPSDIQKRDVPPTSCPVPVIDGMKSGGLVRRTARRCFPLALSLDHKACAPRHRSFLPGLSREASRDSKIAGEAAAQGLRGTAEIGRHTAGNELSRLSVESGARQPSGVSLPPLDTPIGPTCYTSLRCPRSPSIVGSPVVAETVEQCGISQSPVLHKQDEPPCVAARVEVSLGACARLTSVDAACCTVMCARDSADLARTQAGRDSQTSMPVGIAESQGSNNSDGSSGSTANIGDDAMGDAIPTSSKIRTLVVLDQCSARVVRVTRGSSTAFLRIGDSHEEYEVDEVVEWSGGDGDVPSEVVDGLCNVLLLGCNAAILTAESSSSGVPAAVMRGVVQRVLSEVGVAAGSDHEGSLSLSIVQLDGEYVLDLLKDGTKSERLVVAMSPIFGPCVHNAIRLPVGSGGTFDSLLSSALLRAEDTAAGGGLVFISFVLKQKLRTKKGADVFVSSLTVSLVGENADLYTPVLTRGYGVPRALFHYSLGGPCYTVALVCIGDGVSRTGGMLRVQKCLGEVVNRPIYRGSVAKFISGIRDDLLPSLRERLQRSKGCRASNNIIYRLEEMVRDAESLLTSFRANEPRAYLSNTDSGRPTGCMPSLNFKGGTDVGENVQSLVFFEQRLLSSGRINVQGNSVFTHAEGVTHRYDVGEVVLRGPDGDINATLCSRLLDELVRRFMAGHYTALLAADSRNSASTPLILRKIVYLVLQSVKARVGCAQVIGELFVSTALVRNDMVVDLLATEESEALHRLEVEISPLFDRRLRGVSRRVVTSAETFDHFLAVAVERAVPALRAEDPGMMVVSLNLTQYVDKPARDVFVSSFMATTVFDRVSRYNNILSGDTTEPTDLFKLSLGGPCYTVAALGLCDEDEDAEMLLSAQMKLAQVQNRPSCRMSVVRRIDELKKTIYALDGKLNREESEEGKAQIRTKITHARRLLIEGEALLQYVPKEMVHTRTTNLSH